MEEKTFEDYGYGKFQNDRGKMQKYCYVFMLEEFNGSENNDYHFGSQKAVKYGGVSPAVWNEVKPGMGVQCYFDFKKKISYMVPANKA